MPDVSINSIKPHHHKATAAAIKLVPLLLLLSQIIYGHVFNFSQFHDAIYKQNDLHDLLGEFKS